MATRSFPKASLKKNRFRTLAIESFEYRQMLSATSLIGAAGRLDGLESVRVSPFAYDATTRKLIINGDDGVNLASVSIDDHDTTSPLDDEVVASISSGSQTDTFRIQLISDPATMTASVHDVVFNGYAGDDAFTNLLSINSEAYGGLGNDILNGGSGYNCLYGDAGFDTLRAGNQGDYLDGGADADQIFGGIGADTIYGRDGDDIIDAGNGRNYVDGGIGNDSIRCGIGNDIILGLDGNDSIDAGDGNDLVYGGLGDDIIAGNKGNDSLYGEGGNDLIDGGEGVDDVHGGAGNDTLYGLKGDYWGRTARTTYNGVGDSIYGDDGDDLIYAGVYDYVFGGLGKNIINTCGNIRTGR